MSERPEGVPCKAIWAFWLKARKSWRSSPAARSRCRPDRRRPGSEHYEIARYGALRSWAELASLDDAADLLDQTLIEEKDTDVLLTQLAEEQVNVESA